MTAAQKTEKKGFLILLMALILLGAYVLYPFLKTTLLSIILAVLFYPIHKKIFLMTGQRRKLSATFSILLALLFLVIPFSILLFLVTNQTQKLLAQDTNQFLSTWFSTLQIWATKFEDLFQVHFHLLDFFHNHLREWALYLTQFSPNVVLETANFFYHFFIMMIVLFYLFMDGEGFFRVIIHLIPVKDQYEMKLADEMKKTLYGVFYSSFLSGLVQAGLASLGYYFAGIEGFLVWGCVTFFVSFIPLFGTAIVIIPLVLFLFFQGQTGHAVFLGIYCALVVGLVDNILKPILITSNMHPVLLFLSVFSGMSVFGPAGLLIGPLVMSVLTAMIKIYSKDFTGVKLETLTSQDPNPK